MNKEYFAPVAIIAEIDPDEILCVSPFQGGIDDVEREEFPW